MEPRNDIGVLFDLDGVLIDSEGLYSIFWSGIDRKYPTGIDDFASFIKGSTLPKILGYFPVEVHEEIVDGIHRYENEIRYNLYPGAMELLAGLNAACIPAALVTSSDNVKMGYLFNQHPALKGMFTAVVTGSMVLKSKPDPEGYLLGARMIGVEPDRCIVVEDSLQGLSAGRAAGAAVVGIATTLARAELEGRADMIADNVGALTADSFMALRGVSGGN